MTKLWFIPLLFLIISCTSLKDLPEVTSAENGLKENNWVLKELLGNTVSAKDFMKGLPKLNFREENVLEGMTGCNSFSGKYAVGEDLKLYLGAMTKMNCPGPGEEEFIKAITDTSKLLMDGKDLLFVDGDKVLLRFTPAKTN